MSTTTRRKARRTRPNSRRSPHMAKAQSLAHECSHLLTVATATLSELRSDPKNRKVVCLLDLATAFVSEAHEVLVNEARADAKAFTSVSDTMRHAALATAWAGPKGAGLTRKADRVADRAADYAARMMDR
jgi:hypothetical protein